MVLPSQLGFLATLAALLSCSPAATLHVPTIYTRALDGPEALSGSYDYVIIGGGTAGLTVGDRLSEDGKTTVLVIENGELADSDEINNVRDRVSWNAEPWWLYNITSAPNTELENRESAVIIASVTGGGSALNGMQCVRGTTDDYDRVCISNHHPKKLQTKCPASSTMNLIGAPPLDYTQDGRRSNGRELVRRTSVAAFGDNANSLFAEYQFEVFTKLPGVGVPEDSGAGQTGVYWYPTYKIVVDAEGSLNRSYSRTGHWDGLNRANYHLITESKVTKIELDGNKATGVVFRPSQADGGDDEFTTVKANKEIILSAGTIHSPQLLQLSGIRPRKLLESARIETKIELPVRNYSTRPNRRDDFDDPDFITWADELWAANRTGPWSRALWNTGAWLGLPVVAPEAYESIAAKVDAQNAADYLPTGSDPTVIAGYQARLVSLAEAIRRSNNVFYSHYFSGDEPVNYFTYEHPLSLGTVNINTSAPESEPIVDYRTYSNPVDFDIMLELARFHRRINVESPLLAQFDPVETSPGLNVTAREDWVAYMRRNTEPTAMHPTGTCAMMPLELGGVVDEQLRVYGVEGLRVVDASVMSVIVGANLAGTVFAIAEKGADLIKNGAEQCR
ncbi:hypothetical protein EPUS_08114 [Endocarpon pusillum Z07020]|uniref:Glucose-methanol-choline oxidoreductase N-terminal domain-containing protein n=1 Tax=Endocarpon pusillum (strain Z07020 / HMAS-L-300199) TaxID=1263415 RepID=U1GQ22_ENDPU|nr:uncharacterized protein EPUS_08114 [Endocarpon pusillum Z07020]ERF74066.1 hypothetical protein EPUS_08114 [Endocarpon pusillum Z07020]